MRLVLKVCREFDDVTSAGKLFHVRAVATGNARSPTVDSHVGGTFNVEVEDDLDNQEFWRLAEECQSGRLVQVHRHLSVNCSYCSLVV